jgi:hypothetical protein
MVVFNKVVADLHIRSLFSRAQSHDDQAPRPRRATHRGTPDDTTSGELKSAVFDETGDAPAAKRLKADCSATSADVSVGTIMVPTEAFPGLANHIAITHVLRYDYFDAAERARLQSVSRGMRDAVTATDEAFSGLPNYLVRLRMESRGMHDAVTMTGRRVENLNERDAVKFGCLGTLRHLQRRGLLSQEEHLCQAAARS